MMKFPTSLLLAALLVISAAGCKSKKSDTQSTSHAAESLEGQECAACGMTVRDQPAPRGQVIHRDDTRMFFCSVSDMLTYLEAPSPHGSAVALFVESMAQDEDPLIHHLQPHPWIDATKASYVVGFDKEVMGDPILAYESTKQSEAQASRLSAQAMTWTELKAWAAKRRP